MPTPRRPNGPLVAALACEGLLPPTCEMFFWLWEEEDAASVASPQAACAPPSSFLCASPLWSEVSFDHCVCFSPPNPHPTLQAEEAAQPVAAPSGPWAVWEGINVCCSLITAPLVGDEAEPRHLLSPASPPSYIPLLVPLHVFLCNHPDVQSAHSRVLCVTGAHPCVSVSSEMSCANADLIFLQICSTFFTFSPQLSTGCSCTLMNKWIN